MKTNRILVLVTGILALAAGLQAKNFEGRIRQQMTAESGRGAAFMNYFVKEGFLRIDMQVDPNKPDQVMTTLFDMTKREMILLNIPQPKSYMVKALPANQPGQVEKANEGDTPEVIRTGEHEVICGYKCEKVIVKDKNGATTDMWLAENMGTFMSAGGNPMGRPAARKSWEKALGDKGGWPLRVVTKDKKGAEVMRMETVEVEAKPLPESTFTVPEGFKKFEMPSLPAGLRGLLGGKGE
jgi:hypothetical protein